MNIAQRELLAGFDQGLVSLELNSRHIADAVKTYNVCKAAELDRRQCYGQELRHKLENKLTSHAENTYLWVSLVYKRLEDVHREEALNTIRELPPGFDALYSRIFDQLCHGDNLVVKRCIRLLKVMILAYRPLNVLEVESVT